MTDACRATCASRILAASLASPIELASSMVFLNSDEFRLTLGVVLGGSSKGESSTGLTTSGLIGRESENGLTAMGEGPAYRSCIDVLGGLVGVDSLDPWYGGGAVAVDGLRLTLPAATPRAPPAAAPAMTGCVECVWLALMASR